jgi:predicted outer membrane repeat protein
LYERRLHAEGSYYSISGLTISNGAETSGGGIANFGSLTLDGSAVSGNTATGAGGGVFTETGATLEVTNSTISGNSASTGGGGGNAGFAAIANSTVAANTVTGDGGGVSTTASLTVNNSTVAGNTAGGSGGGISSSSPLSLSSSIVAKNSASTGPDVSGVIASADYSLIEDTSGWSITSDGGHNRNGVDPLLELGEDPSPALRDNGGPTPTIALGQI